MPVPAEQTMIEFQPAAPFNERFPAAELKARHARMRGLLRAVMPEADGLLLMGDTCLYYASGTMPAGALWLPADGEPVLFVRKGLDRARQESPLANIVPFRSFSEFAALSREAGSPMPEHGRIAINMAAVTWSTAELLKQKLPGVKFVSGDAIIKRCRSVKSSWEIAKIRRAGAIHTHCLRHELPALLHPGMTEWQIAGEVKALYRASGDSGYVRLTAPGRVSFGGVAAGDSGLYPIAFDGPLGLRGLHPAVPYGGSREAVWQAGQLLTVDMPCCVEGYLSDKTVTYFSGRNVPDDVKAAADCCADIYEQTRSRLSAWALPSELWALAQSIAAKHGLAECFMGFGPERVRFLGHGIGLEMDEYPAIAAKFGDPLEPGMVISLEPKIAVPGKGMVGMEDTFLVGSGPAESLSGPAQPLVFVD